MKIESSFCSNRICFDNLLLSDVSSQYHKWINDNEVTRFTSIFGKTTEKDLFNYVKKNLNSDNAILLKMQMIDNNYLHFGNFRVSEINLINKSCDLALLIGEKKLWGKGLGGEAIKIITNFIYHKYSIKYFFSFININNLASIKIFKKNNFIETDSKIVKSFKKNTTSKNSKVLYKFID